jgi:hypothetical protein
MKHLLLFFLLYPQLFLFFFFQFFSFSFQHN